jgi:hypothetical protein
LARFEPKKPKMSKSAEDAFAGDSPQEEATKIIAKALKLNGKKGFNFISFHIRKRKKNSEVRMILRRALKILLLTDYLDTSRESYDYEDAIDLRKFVADTKRTMRYAEARWSPLSYQVEGLLSPSLRKFKKFDDLARAILMLVEGPKASHEIEDSTVADLCPIFREIQNL